MSLSSSFDEQDAGLRTTDPLHFDGYTEQLDAARADAGIDEGCIWGWGEIDGVRCALVVFDFSFLGGSMGMVVGEKVARAFDAATEQRAPVVTITASGGARMQEGMWSLVQMAKTVEARRQHKQAGLAHITLLTSPTTGGVYASFASLADVIFAEADATIGFAGPRVVAELTGAAPPSDVHTAAFASAHGLVDAIVPPDEAADAIGLTLRCLTNTASSPARATEKVAQTDGARLSAWERLELVRSDDRIKGGRLIRELIVEGIELRGDRVGGGDDERVIVRIGGLEGQVVVGIAQDAVGDGRIRPEGFRKAIRAFELAGRLGLPVVVVIDTRGADPLPSSEGAGIAVSIARTFEALLACPSPTVAVLVGEGGSGGALAMAVTDRVIASANAVFSVIAPEAAAAILYRDASRGSELAERLRITVGDLESLGFVDVVVPEGVDGVVNPLVSMDELTDALSAELDGLARVPIADRLAKRHERWRGTALPLG
jgi:acetyl-CoA carboxylase carboxyl transferase subunit beta